MKSFIHRPKPYKQNTVAGPSTMSHTRVRNPESDPPVFGNWNSDNTVFATGVAISHIASRRVVLCYHTTRRYYFLPKGYRDASAEMLSAAESEGFKASGYRNRLLPLPIPTHQPQVRNSSPSGAAFLPLVTEPVWTQFVNSATPKVQYILSWYIAETLPRDLEVSLSVREQQAMAYQRPPKFEANMTLKERIKLDEDEGYQPIRHQNTNVEHDSFLVPVEEAIEALPWGGISADVVRKGWEAIASRHEMEVFQRHGARYLGPMALER